MHRSVERFIGESTVARLGSGLALAGLALLIYCAAAYAGLLPGGYERIPEPAALSGGLRSARASVPVAPTAQAESAARLDVASQSALSTAPAVAAIATTMSGPGAVARLEPADLDERRQESISARPGAPVRLRLPSIDVETDVRSGGLRVNDGGDLEWETLPFVAVNYPQLGPVGRRGNPVIAGHVVTRFEGNVFRDLNRLQLGAPIEVFTEQSRFSYVVDEIKLVTPDSVEVMAPADDARLTLITCGGTFDPINRSFSERLVVVGKLVDGQRL